MKRELAFQVATWISQQQFSVETTYPEMAHRASKHFNVAISPAEISGIIKDAKIELQQKNKKSCNQATNHPCTNEEKISALLQKRVTMNFSEPFFEFIEKMSSNEEMRGVSLTIVEVPDNEKISVFKLKSAITEFLDRQGWGVGRDEEFLVYAYQDKNNVWVKRDDGRNRR